jgi:CBS domain-containing protein
MATVAQLLDRKPRAIHSIEPDAPVLEAIRKMAEHGVGALLVVSDGQLKGILSERDYARKVILKGRSSSDTPVRDIMSWPVHTVPPALSSQECMKIMTERRVRHLPVLDGNQLLGMLSIGDLVRAVLEEQAQTIEQLETYIRS